MSENNEAVRSGFKPFVFEIIKAVIIAVVISLVAVLVAAFVIKIANLGTEAVPIVNQVIRSVAILLACLISLREKGNGWLRGMIVGFAYSLLAYVIFSLIGGSFSFDITLLNNLVIGTASGLISGIIAMLIRRN